MAMALLVAGYPIDDTDCIRKSYPQFLQQYPPT
jgi:5-enolpyruvylshikimate-3-phosphate synthase